MVTPDIPVGEAVNYPDQDTLSPRDYLGALQRQQVSMNGFARVGVQIVLPEGTPGEVRDVSLTVLEDGAELLVVNDIEESKEGEGVYEATLTPKVTKRKGVKKLLWKYTLDEEFEYEDEVFVSNPMPTYDRLNDNEKAAIAQVSYLFADMFDSTNGGAFLSENFQSHFNFERFAQLSQRAIQKINISYQPVTNFRFGPGQGSSLPLKYYGIMVSATYLEVLRHLMRSYVEQPEFRNMSTTYTDRRDYLNRWKTILDEEKGDLEKAIANMKRDQLGLGRGALLVSGGIFGGANGYFTSSTYAGSTRTFRFYPTITAMSTRY